MVRYMTANRQNFDKTLQLLMRRKAQTKLDFEVTAGEFSSPESTSTVRTGQELSASANKVEARRPTKEALTET